MPKLLIIDDERDFLETIQKRFEMRSYEVITRDTGKDVEKLIRKDPEIDVVILDLKMPEIPGDEVLKTIKTIKPDIQVIILTGHGNTESAIELSKHDLFTYLQKPIEIDKLVKYVENARTKAKLVKAEQHEGDGKKGKSIKQVIIMTGISIACGLFVALLPASEGLEPRAQYFLGLLTTIILLWVLEAIPIGLTVILAGGGLALFGIQSPAAAWQPYASPAVMFVLMIIMFGVILNEVGIAQRILYYAIKFAGRGVLKFSIVIALVSSIASSIFHDATITKFSYLQLFLFL